MKNVQMSVKMEPSLRDQFMAIAQEEDKPAAQIIRALIRAYISNKKYPNAETIAALQAIEDEDCTIYKDAESLYKKLGL